MGPITMKVARTMAGLTQREMAEKLGVTTTTYRNYETSVREIPLSLAFKFSDIVGVDIYHIIFFNPKVTENVTKWV